MSERGGIVVLDFCVGYLSHRTMHMWPAMWKFHQIHHNDPFVDVTTTVETLGRTSVTVANEIRRQSREPCWYWGNRLGRGRNRAAWRRGS